ncbi:HAD-IA family hydrolase [Novosphingobium bradum]|uniref:HAD-IA family hydrolase n=1 Tax=Novosphingobium bradum TaxID=1737444 RepID=A0ABV7IKC9_9SPHN
MTTRLAVFDCDGTLVDGQGAVVSAMAMAFAEVRLAPPDPHQVRRMVGLSLPQAVMRLAPGADGDQVREAVAAYKAAFRAARAAGTLAEPLFPGMADLLADLASAGWTLAVATGKSDAGLAHCLAGHGIAGHFASLQTADRHPSKPHPAMLEAALAETGADPAAAVMIGDTAYDMAMATSIGVRAIGVAWGYHEAAELTAAGADYVARDAADLREYLLA